MLLNLQKWKEKSIWDLSKFNDYKTIPPFYIKGIADAKYMIEYYNYMIEHSGQNPLVISRCFSGRL